MNFNFFDVISCTQEILAYNNSVRSVHMSEKKIRIKFDGVDRSESLEEKLIETFQKLELNFF